MTLTKDEAMSQITLCMACPNLCRAVCPDVAATRRESAAPSNKAALLYLMFAPSASFSADAVSVFRPCHGCHACRDACPYEVDIPSLVAWGEELVTRGRPA